MSQLALIVDVKALQPGGKYLRVNLPDQYRENTPMNVVNVASLLQELYQEHWQKKRADGSNLFVHAYLLDYDTGMLIQIWSLRDNCWQEAPANMNFFDYVYGWNNKLTLDSELFGNLESK